MSVTAIEIVKWAIEESIDSPTDDELLDDLFLQGFNDIDASELDELRDQAYELMGKEGEAIRALVQLLKQNHYKNLEEASEDLNLPPDEVFQLAQKQAGLGKKDN